MTSDDNNVSFKDVKGHLWGEEKTIIVSSI